MQPDRWRLVRSTFLEVCDLDSDARERALAGVEPWLRGEVLSLLSGEEGGLDRRMGELTGDDCERTDAPYPVRMAGPYLLCGEIGRGGMGVVHRAERVDRHFDKTVAVKLLRRDLVDEASVRRFRRERQALARLDHPSIARLLDGGVTTDGAPYLVMELIDGDAICAHAERNDLSLRRRLELFGRVCDAVQYAHRQLVVHRDLKPSNILVDREGEVKLLDFGLAVLLDRDDESGAPVTASGQQAFTLEYASPEQMRGRTLGVATDIYSLGVVLYELLTGRRPFQREPGTSSELAARLLGTTVTAPSAVVATPRLRRRLRGDLDRIVLRALHDDPEHRYASVQDLARDIAAFLANRPVTVRRDSAFYRTSRFVRRHRVGVLVAALFVGVVFASGASVVRSERSEALARQRAEATTSFLVDVLSAADPGHAGGEAPIRHVLASASERIDNELQAQPAVRAAVRDALAQCLIGLGMYDDAATQLRRLRDEHRSDEEVAWSAGAATANSLANALHGAGRLDEAEALLRETLGCRSEVSSQEAEMVAQTRNNLGAVLSARGQLDEAEQLLAMALATRRSLDDPLAVAESLNNLAGIARLRGDLEMATARAREALAVRRDQLPTRHPLVIQSVANLAMLLHVAGEVEAAEASYREVYELAREVLGTEHPDLTYVADNFASLLCATGRHAEARPLLEHSLSIWLGAVSAGDPRRVSALIRLAECVAAIGDPDVASELLEQAAAESTAAHGADSPLARQVRDAAARLPRPNADRAGGPTESRKS